MHDPLSVRKAMGVIVAATLVSVVVGGVLITVVDPEEFPDLGTGLWWALQTVTTVGYGDVTPENTAGRLVGALFLLEAISFVTIVTAVITSSFVERARQQRIADTETAEAVGAEQLTAQLSEITSRLERIQQTLDSGGSAEQPRSDERQPLRVARLSFAGTRKDRRSSSVPGQQVLQDGNGDRAREHEQRVDHGPEEGRASASSDGVPDQGDQGGEEVLGALEFRGVGQ